MKKTAIIVAAGTNKQTGTGLPMQFSLVKDKPLLYYPIQSFLNAFSDLEVILVLPEDYMAMGQEVVDGYFDNRRVTICRGGNNRFESVRNGIERLSDDDSIVFVHDGIRCLVSEDLIRRCYEEAIENNTAVPVLEIEDNLRLVEDAQSRVLSKDEVRLVQTPQTFHGKILKTAFSIDYKPAFIDEATVVEAYGLMLNLIPGEPENFKISDEMDLLLAEYILSKRNAD